VTRKMTLVGFMQAGNTSVYTGSWRHPATEPGFLSASYYQQLGRTLEAGCFDMMFFDDRLAMPGIYGGSVAEAVRTGARPVKLDLSIVLGLLAGATQHIGLGATYSTTYYQPFHVARTFATLDHLSGGRAAWNIVTSINDSEAQNYGLDETLEHDARYSDLDPSRRIGRDAIAILTFSATANASSRLICGRRMANSSPPSRPNRSPARRFALQVSVTA